MGDRSVLSVTDWYRLRNCHAPTPFYDNFKYHMNIFLRAVTPLHGPLNAPNKTPAGHCLETLYYDDMRKILKSSGYRPKISDALNDLHYAYQKISEQTKQKHATTITEHRVIDWFYRILKLTLCNGGNVSVPVTQDLVRVTERDVLSQFDDEFDKMRSLTQQLRESHNGTILQQTQFSTISVDDEAIEKHVTNRWGFASNDKKNRAPVTLVAAPASIKPTTTRGTRRSVVATTSTKKRTPVTRQGTKRALYKVAPANKTALVDN